jgi:hypothetical protein
MKPTLFPGHGTARLRSLIGAVLTGALLFVVVSRAQAQNTFPQENAWHRITPSVVWCGDPESAVTIEVHIVGRDDVAGVEVTNRDEDDRIALYDDGTHGDAAADDRVYTASDVLLHCDPEDRFFQETRDWWGFLRVTLDDGSRVGNNFGMVAGMVHPRYRGTFEHQAFGDGLSATAYAFFIADHGHEVLDGYPVASVYCGTANYEAFRRFYGVLPDDFDFVLLMPGMQLLRPDGFAENVPYDVLVSNAVENIGLPIMDNAAAFGSSGRLKSMIYHSFGDLAIFDHEVAHTWGAGIGAGIGLLQEGRADQGHWLNTSDIGGQLGAYYFDGTGSVGHFADNGDGTWRLIATTVAEAYAPLELYVMGLIPPEEVPPIHVLEGIDLTDPERITARSVRTVTIEDIIAAEGGVRIPLAGEAQTAFNLGFIIVSEEEPNEAAYAFFSLLSRSLMTTEPPGELDDLAPFLWATGGRATLNTRLPLDLAEPDETPSEPVPTRTVPAVEANPPAPPTAESRAGPPPTGPALPCLSSTLTMAFLPLVVIWSGWRANRRRSMGDSSGSAARLAGRR